MTVARDVPDNRRGASSFLTWLASAEARTRQRLESSSSQHQVLDSRAPEPEPRPRSRRTNRRKAKSRRRQPPPSWYPSSWRGLRSSARTPESFGLNNPETTPTQFQPPPRRDHGSRSTPLSRQRRQAASPAARSASRVSSCAASQPDASRPTTLQTFLPRSTPRTAIFAIALPPPPESPASLRRRREGRAIPQSPACRTSRSLIERR